MAKPPSRKESGQTPPPSSDDDPALAELTKRVTAVVGRDQASRVVAQVVALFKEERFSGPVAHPKHLREYEEILPGAADRIIGLAEKSLQHQQSVQARALEADIEDARAGRKYGFAALLLLIVSALVTGLLGHELLAAAFLGTGIVGVIGIFVRGRISSTED